MDVLARWTLEGRIMEDSELGDFTLLWTVASGPPPKQDGQEVEVVDADAYRGAVEALVELARMTQPTPTFNPVRVAIREALERLGVDPSTYRGQS